jgi:hypothetical protein
MYPRRPVWITAKQLPDFQAKRQALIEYMKIIHGGITPPTNAYIARIS